MILVHATSASSFLTTAKQTQRLQTVIDTSLQQCMGITSPPGESLAVDCGILPLKMLQAIESISMHNHFMLVKDKTRPGVQAFLHNLQQPETEGNITSRMKKAFDTLEQAHLWNHTPQPLHNCQRVQHKKTIMKAHRKQAQQRAGDIWRRELLSGLPAPGKGPESPFQHYLQMAEHDIRRKKLHRPAEYLTGRARIPLHGALRARCQASGGLRGEREDPLSPRPYQARHCTRCHPQTPNQLFYYTHLAVDNIQHVTTEYISTQLPRNKLTAKMNNVMLDYGMTERWIDLTPIERTALVMGSTPLPRWKLRKEYKTWIPITLPSTAGFAMEMATCTRPPQL